MAHPDFQVPDCKVAEVIAEAARLYAQNNSSYSLDELEKIGLQAQIPPEITRQAVQIVKARYLDEQEGKRKRREQLTRQAQRIAIGTGQWLFAIALILGGFKLLFTPVNRQGLQLIDAQTQALELEMGRSQKDVINLLGKPDETQARLGSSSYPDSMQWTYQFCKKAWWGCDTLEINFSKYQTQNWTVTSWQWD